MNVNSFFERVVCIVGPKMNWEKWSRGMAKRGITVEGVELVDSRFLVMPRENGMLSRSELAHLLTFYRVIADAAKNRLNRVLILNGPVKLRADFSDWEEEIIGGLHRVPWDIALLGGSNFQFNQLDSVFGESRRAVRRVISAEGLFAVGVNHSFYPHFLDVASVPTAPLKEYIGRSFLRFDIVASVPPVILNASKQSQN